MAILTKTYEASGNGRSLVGHTSIQYENKKFIGISELRHASEINSIGVSLDIKNGAAEYNLVINKNNINYEEEKVSFEINNIIVHGGAPIINKIYLKISYEATAPARLNSSSLFYKKNDIDNDICDLIAQSNKNLRIDLVSKLADYGYNTTAGDLWFVRSGAGSISGWAQDTLNLDYYDQTNTQVPFTTKESCPMPQLFTGGEHYLALNYSGGSTTYYLKYNSEVDYCQQSIDGTNWTKIDDGFNGVFVILQGAGGGGGEGSCLNAGIASACGGGAGGGGGAFALAYLNLKAIPDEIVTLTRGAAGIGAGTKGDHVQTGTPAATGGNGGDSILSYKNKAIITAGGGRGGSGGNRISEIPAKGGNGGTVTTNLDDSTNWITLIAKIDGKKGGLSGYKSGYAFGVPLGTKPGEAGASYSSRDAFLTPILSSPVPIYRSGSTWTIKYTSGAGTDGNNAGTPGYTSGGGGGGASVMSQKNNDRPTEPSGFGIGGAGGSAESATVHTSYNGKVGYIGWLSCIKL